MDNVSSIEAINDLLLILRAPLSDADLAGGWSEEARLAAIEFSEKAISAIVGRKPHERCFVRYLLDRGVGNGPLLYKVAVVERILNSGEGHPPPHPTPTEVFAERVAETVRYWVDETVSNDKAESTGAAKAPAALRELLSRLQPKDVQTIKDALAYCAQGSAFGIMVGLDGDSGMTVGYDVSITDEASGKSILGDLHDELVGRFMVREEWVG